MKNAPPIKVTGRRQVLMGGALGLCAVGAGAAHWFNLWADVGATELSVSDAHDGAQRGAFVLVDIRRPDEWAATGIPEHALPIDMRRSDFVAALSAELGGDYTRPVALICARGVRSRRLRAQLQDAGFTNVLDVPEGMLGSGAGPGWLARTLPLTNAVAPSE